MLRLAAGYLLVLGARRRHVEAHRVLQLLLLTLLEILYVTCFSIHIKNGYDCIMFFNVCFLNIFVNPFHPYQCDNKFADRHHYICRYHTRYMYRNRSICHRVLQLQLFLL